MSHIQDTHASKKTLVEMLKRHVLKSAWQCLSPTLCAPSSSWWRPRKWSGCLDVCWGSCVPMGRRADDGYIQVGLLLENPILQNPILEKPIPKKPFYLQNPNQEKPLLLENPKHPILQPSYPRNPTYQGTPQFTYISPLYLSYNYRYKK